MPEHRRPGLVLTSAVVADLHAHAGAALPREACGLLAGTHGRVEAVHRAANTAARRDRYAIDAREQMAIRDRIAAAGMRVVAVYHSHATAPAVPSPADLALSFVPRLPHVIVGPADGEAVIRAYLLNPAAPADRRVTEVEVAVADDPAPAA